MILKILMSIAIKSSIRESNIKEIKKRCWHSHQNSLKLFSRKCGVSAINKERHASGTLLTKAFK